MQQVFQFLRRCVSRSEVLDQASTNAEDGVSAVQTAEGALTEVHDMLQRMNELAVQAANGTNSESDRSAIQDEISQLTTEIDRVSETTKFNEMYLLKGNSDKSTKTVTLGGHDAGLDKLRLTTESANAMNSTTVDSFKYTIDKTKLTGAVTIGGKNYNIIKKGEESKGVTNGVKDTDQSYITTGKALALIKEALEQANKIGDTAKHGSVNGSIGNVGDNDASGTVEFTVNKAQTKTEQSLAFNLHVGADTDMNNKIGVDIEAMNSKYLGIKDIDVVGKKDGKNTDDGGIAATYAIDAIADAVAKVSKQRSALGAVQNRLEHTIKNVDNVVENTTSAESRIRDTDMADEMVNYSKNNILAQAPASPCSLRQISPLRAFFPCSADKAPQVHIVQIRRTGPRRGPVLLCLNLSGSQGRASSPFRGAFWYLLPGMASASQLPFQGSLLVLGHGACEFC